MSSTYEWTVDEWIEQIDRGLEYRRLYGVEDKWAEIEALFYGVHESQKNVAGPNILAATGDGFLSDLSVPSPYITVRPTRPETAQSVGTLEGVDNYLVGELRVPHAVDTMMLHAFLWSRGIGKIGYDSEFGYARELDVMPGVGITASQFDRRGNRIEFGRGSPGMPWLSACLPHDIVVPWGTGPDIQTAPWIAHRVCRHIDDVRADRKYSGTRSLAPSMSMQDFVASYTTVAKPYRGGETLSRGTHESDDLEEYVEMWEVHCARTRKIHVLASGHPKFLRSDVDRLQLPGLPFVSIGFVPRARTFWTSSDAFYLLQSQAELNDITLQAMKQRRINALKFLYAEGAMDPAQIDNLMSAYVGAGAKVNAGFDIDKVIRPMQAGTNIPLQQDAEYVRRNAREVVGMSRNALGEFDASTRRTATEASIVQAGGASRMSRRQKALRDCYVEIIERLNAVIFQFWRTPRVVQIVGAAGAATFEQFVASDLAGEYTYDVGFTSFDWGGMEARRAQATQLYGALAQDPTVDPGTLRRVLLAAFNDPRLTGLFGPVLGGQDNASARLSLPGGPRSGGATPPDAAGVGAV